MLTGSGTDWIRWISISAVRTRAATMPPKTAA